MHPSLTFLLSRLSSAPSLSVPVTQPFPPAAEDMDAVMETTLTDLPPWSIKNTSTIEAPSEFAIASYRQSLTSSQVPQALEHASIHASDACFLSCRSRGGRDALWRYVSEKGNFVISRAALGNRKFSDQITA
ncbi:hypothetical protein BV25DRAFT_1825455 [Artomyces pyxidatus]|uniref:Uncharacterized protein n=1 Tax=Artomyces pyxidatus TaxID=48021 RepID=A0ACB8T196_9AGAM|nr:hypothetical protein BV25DRAFT_1825455 [Artomyces pyxidatus]